MGNASIVRTRGTRTTTRREKAKEIAFPAINSSKSTDHYFIGDTGASCHMVHSDDGLFNAREINEPVTFGNGQTVMAVKIGDKRMILKQKDGIERCIILKNVKMIPKLAPYNLFSITWALNRGFKLGNDGKQITLSKDDFVMKFDREITTNTGYVAAVELKPREEDEDEKQASLSNENDVTNENESGKISIGKKKQAGWFHQVLGHMNDECTKKTAKYYDIELQGKLEPCEKCLIGKARQKNVLKETTTEKSKTPGHRLYIDISSIKSESFGKKKFWLLIVDEATDNCWSYFLKQKSQTAKTVAEFVQNLKSKENVVVRYIRCDNAGENKKIEEKTNQLGLGIKFEYTAPNTPQQNGVVERKFATLYGRVRTMFADCEMGPETKIRKGLWTECANTATKNENVSVRDVNPPFTKFHGRDSRIVPHLHRFGEMGVVTTKKKIQGKIETTGKVAIFVGYAENHSGDTFRMFNPETKKILISRDVRWLNKVYGKWARENASQIDPEDIVPDEIKSEFVQEVVEDKSETGREEAQKRQVEVETATETDASEPPVEEAKEEETSQPTPRQGWSDNARLIRELARLGTSYNEDASKMLDEAKEQNEKLNLAFEEQELGNIGIDEVFKRELAFLVSDGAMEMKSSENSKETNPYFVRSDATDDELMDILEAAMNNKSFSEREREGWMKNVILRMKERKPTNFREAWDHPNERMRTRWRAGIHKEFRDMINRGVWRRMKRRDIPQGRQCIKNKWVFEIKRNGIFRPRLVACGYSQIPGVDFTESYAPVIHDVTWRILLIAKMVLGLKAKIIDVETAFLHGDLEEEIYMNSPDGLGHNQEEECVKLEKSMYGLVQGACQYFTKFATALRKIGFTGGYADPCMMVRRDKHGIVFIAVYVDDSLLIGNDEAIEAVIRDIEDSGFKLKVSGELDDYLSCEITFNEDGSVAWIQQPHLVEKIEIKFWDLVKNLQKYKTPGSQGITILRNPDAVIPPFEHALYQSGTGMLLYLVKHLRPDLANAVCQLSKALDKPNEAAFKEMKRILKYTIDTKDLALRMEPKLDEDGQWFIVAFSDSDFAGDVENRVSVAGFVVYLCGAPISWKSKGIKSVSLSSSEAEYVALSEAAKEVKFIYQVLTSMGIKVKLPIVVRVDNIGAIFMSENVTVSPRTKHVDVRYHFVREFVFDGFIKVLFVRTTENDADLFNKNLPGALHKKHAEKMLVKKGELK